MAETTDIYCPTGLEARGPGSRCHRGWFLPRVEGESASRLSSTFCWLAGQLWNLGLVETSLQSLLSWSHNILLVFVSVSNIPLFITTPVILGKGSVLPQDDHILTVPSGALFSYGHILRYGGLRTSLYEFWRDNIQSTTNIIYKNTDRIILQTPPYPCTSWSSFNICLYLLHIVFVRKPNVRDAVEVPGSFHHPLLFLGVIIMMNLYVFFPCRFLYC